MATIPRHLSLNIFSLSLLPSFAATGEMAGLFVIEEEVEVFWLRGRVFFALIYQSWRLASNYWDYSLTSDSRLCETTSLFTTCLRYAGCNC